MSNGVTDGAAKLERDENTRKHYRSVVRDDFKFKGEPPWTPYLYDMVVSGPKQVENQSSHTKWLIQIGSQDKVLFPDLILYAVYYVLEDHTVDMVTAGVEDIPRTPT